MSVNFISSNTVHLGFRNELKCATLVEDLNVNCVSEYKVTNFLLPPTPKHTHFSEHSIDKFPFYILYFQ